MDLGFPLARLEDEQILRRAKEEDTFSFKHSLTQETVYHALLKSQRRAMHRAVAEAMEVIYADRKGKMSDVLAYHWELAEVPDRARRYLFRAAQNALRSYSNQEALALLTRALAQREGAKPQDILALYEARAQVFEAQGHYDQAIADYQAAKPLAHQANRAIDECRMLSSIAWDLSLCGKFDEAVAIAESAKACALEQQDQMAVLRAYLVQGLAMQAKGQVNDAHAHLRTMLMGSQLSEQVVMEGESWYYLGILYDLMGRFGRAALCAKKAYDIKKGLSDHPGEILALFLRARAEGARGQYDAAFDALELARTRSEEIHNLFGLAEYPNTRAWLAAELGDWQTAYEFDQAGLEVARQSFVRQPEINTLLNLFLDCAMLGKVEQATSYANQLRAWMKYPEYGYHIWRWQLRYDDALARLLMAQSCYDDAVKIVAQLLAGAEHTQSIKYQARGLVLRAQINIARGELHSAPEDLLTACHLADGMNYVPVRIQARQWLTRAYEKTDPGKAQQYNAQATHIVQELDQQLKNTDLRLSFESGIGKFFATQNAN
jgi:tetratricopeptide (TPR) repeat protein